MTTLPVDQAHKDSLSRQGYAISEWIGFADHWIPFYAHHPVSDKQVGDVVWKMRVGNPKTLNNAEANTVAKQAHNGYFMWRPDKECMAHAFKDITLRKRPGGGEEKIVGEPYMGCRWCRERAGSTSPTPTPAEAVSAVGIPPPASAAAPPPPIPSYDVLHCKSCPEVFTGENAVNDRRGHVMRKHKKATAAAAASDKDSGKEIVR